MKKKNLTALMAAMALSVVACGSLLCGNGIVSYEGETDGLTSATAEITPRSHCTSVEMPTLVNTIPDTHYLFTAYELYQEDPHATEMQFYTYPSLPSPSYTKQCAYQEKLTVLGIPNVGNKSCDPYPYFVKARCTVCNVTSASMTSLANVTPVNCVYTPIAVKTSGTIYQNFDIGAPDVDWQHHADKGQTIYYSIAYNGIVADGNIVVPGWIPSSRSATHTLDGVTFTVRVNAGYVSIKADETIACDNINTAFAFGTSN